MYDHDMPITWRGVIESRPMATLEDPEQIIFMMRSSEGKFVEVFVARDLVQQMPEAFKLGQPITITGESIPVGETPEFPIVVFAESAKAK